MKALNVGTADEAELFGQLESLMRELRGRYRAQASKREKGNKSITRNHLAIVGEQTRLMVSALHGGVALIYSENDQVDEETTTRLCGEVATAAALDFQVFAESMTHDAK